MRYPLQIIADGVRIVVHGIDTPFIPRPVMRLPQNTVNDGIAHVDVGRRHIDLCAQTLFPVGIFSFAHFGKELEVFRNAPVPPGAFLAALGKRAAGSADFRRAHVAHESLAVLYQFNRVIIDLFEIIGSISFLIPFESQPADIAPDSVHKFRLFLGRIGIVEKQIALAVIFFLDTEVDAHAFRVPYVKIPVRFGRETRINAFDFAAFQFFVDDLFDKIRSFCHIQHLMRNGFSNSIAQSHEIKKRNRQFFAEFFGGTAHLT